MNKAVKELIKKLKLSDEDILKLLSAKSESGEGEEEDEEDDNESEDSGDSDDQTEAEKKLAKEKEVSSKGFSKAALRKMLKEIADEDKKPAQKPIKKADRKPKAAKKEEPKAKRKEEITNDIFWSE